MYADPTEHLKVQDHLHHRSLGIAVAYPPRFVVSSLRSPSSGTDHLGTPSWRGLPGAHSHIWIGLDRNPKGQSSNSNRMDRHPQQWPGLCHSHILWHHRRVEYMEHPGTVPHVAFSLPDRFHHDFALPISTPVT